MWITLRCPWRIDFNASEGNVTDDQRLTKDFKGSGRGLIEGSPHLPRALVESYDKIQSREPELLSRFKPRSSGIRV
jgi:hypothetical protein